MIKIYRELFCFVNVMHNSPHPVSLGEIFSRIFNERFLNISIPADL